jgi:hypothetical protein
MKLQFIHKTNSALKASSLYCQWISTGQGEGGRLVAIWMDREMRAFEGESSHEAGMDGQVAGVAEVTGDPLLHVWSDEAREPHNEEARQP